MAVAIRLKRLGKKKKPVYRLVVADKRTQRDGATLEEVGFYDPLKEPVQITIKKERVEYWLSVGAQPTKPARRLLAELGVVDSVKVMSDFQNIAKKDRDNEEILQAQKKEASSAEKKDESEDKPKKEVSSESVQENSTEKSQAEVADIEPKNNTVQEESGIEKESKVEEVQSEKNDTPQVEDSVSEVDNTSTSEESDAKETVASEDKADS